MAFETGLAVTMLRVEGGLDWEEHKAGLHHASEHKPGLNETSEHQPNENKLDLNGTTEHRHHKHHSEHRHSIHQISEHKRSLHRRSSEQHSKPILGQGSAPAISDEADLKDQAEHKAKVRAINIRRKRRAYMMTFEYPGYLLEGAGNIDVWWLYHDGGLTMLIPYIISERSTWTDTKLRIFSICNEPGNVEAERESMATLLDKFRISYSTLTILEDIWVPPQPETVDEFNKLVDKFRNSSDEACQITEDMFSSMSEKTLRHLRLHELMRKHSPHARLIVMSLPMPRKGEVAAPLYMAWLEMLSKDLPPFLFVRGNKTKVLTYYL